MSNEPTQSTNPEADENQIVDMMDLRKRFAELPDRWRTALRLGVEGYLQREIADRMHITTARVSQILGDAKRRLYESAK